MWSGIGASSLCGPYSGETGWSNAIEPVLGRLIDISRANKWGDSPVRSDPLTGHRFNTAHQRAVRVIDANLVEWVSSELLGIEQVNGPEPLLGGVLPCRSSSEG